MMKSCEIWKDVPDYEGLYQVSTLGRIKSYPKTIVYNLRNIKERFYPERLLESFSDRVGYRKVNLYKNGKIKQWLVHRLVAITFIPNPNNLPQVNHKDENKVNNNVDNLEWCTAKYNSNYGSHPYQLTIEGRKSPKKSKTIGQFSKSGKLINMFPSASEAARQTNLNRGNISSVINGIRLSCGGFYWKFI